MDNMPDDFEYVCDRCGRTVGREEVWFDFEGWPCLCPVCHLEVEDDLGSKGATDGRPF